MAKLFTLAQIAARYTNGDVKLLKEWLIKHGFITKIQKSRKFKNGHPGLGKHKNKWVFSWDGYKDFVRKWRFVKRNSVPMTMVEIQQLFDEASRV